MRALRFLVAACLAVPLTGTAHAEVVPSCPYDASTKVLHAETVTGGAVSVLVHRPNAADTYVCVDTPATGWVVVLHAAASPQVPIYTTVAEGECPLHVTYGAIRVSVGVGPEPSVCVGHNGTTTTYTFGVTAGVEVWRSGGRVTDNAFCLNEYLVWLSSPWAPDDYTPCYYGMHRVL